MGNTSEEITARMAMDTDPFSKALTKSKDELQKFSETGKSGFVKAEEGGRAFKKMMENIKEQSPLMGNALQLALSPVAGIMAVATLGLKYFKGQLEETNKLLDMVGAANAKRIGDAKGAAGETKKQMDADHKSFQELAASGAPDQTKNLLDASTPANAKRNLGLVEAARHKVSGRILDYESGAGAKQKENRRNDLNKAKSQLADLETALKEQEAIRDKTSDMAAEYEAHTGKSGRGNTGIQQLVFGTKNLTGSYTIAHSENEGAISQIQAIKQGIAHRKGLIDKLTPIETSQEEGNKADVADLKGLDAAHTKLRSMVGPLGAPQRPPTPLETRQAWLMERLISLASNEGLKLQLPE